jgi:hypothetical protein
LIPAAVECEFIAGQPIGKSFLEATASGLIQVSTLTMSLDPLLKSLLDEGEAAVIQLAQALVRQAKLGVSCRVQVPVGRGVGGDSS